jgi:uncharacterized alkaline shock family protein YloU
MNTEPLSSGRNIERDASKGNEVSFNTPARIRGKTFIEDDVISIIARVAAEQVPGVHQIGESSLRSLFSRLGRHHGVEAETGLKEAAADLEIVVEFAYPIRAVTEEVRERVIEAVESMAGRKMVEVNIFVMDIHVPKTTASRRRRELE